MKIESIVSLFAVFFLITSLQAQTLEQSFLSPPDSAKPYTWWHWVDGNVSKEGIIDDTTTTERVLWDVRTTVADLMHENYFGYFAEKCHQNGMKLAIEPYGSGSFDATTTSLIADIPMTSSGHTTPALEWK